MIYEERPYQTEAKNAILSEWNAGVKKTLLVLPTGCGKTVVCSNVIDERVKSGGRVLFMAHRGELLSQASKTIHDVTGLDCSLEKASSSSLGSSAPVTVGSIQSLAQDKRLNSFDPDYFNDIIVDEAHHCLSDSYQKVLGYFANANVLGVTATPDRGDQKNLGKYFDSRAYEYSMIRGIREGYLAPIKAQTIPLTLDISQVRIQNGDYSSGDIGRSLEPCLEAIAKQMIQYCKGRKTVVFLPLVKTSQMFCKILNRHKKHFKAAEVNGMSKDREKVIKDFERGKYNVLCNSMLLTEGWDCPSVDCVIVLRPTQSRSLYQQIVGRGMRPAPGKKELLLLDFLWLTAKHSLCKPSCLIGRDEDMAKRIDKKIDDAPDGIDLIEAGQQVERDILEEREAALAQELETMRSQKSNLVDPIQFAFSIAAEELLNYAPTFKCESQPATEKQLNFLKNRGVSIEHITCKGQASMIIGLLSMRQDAGLTTPKQIRCLEKFGFHQVGTWSFKAASDVISQLAGNRWTVPASIDPATFTPTRYDVCLPGDAPQASA